MNSLPKFETTDPRIKFYHLMLEMPGESIQHYSLPDGYHFTTYKVGDKESWIDIELSAKELKTREDGERFWKEYFAPWENLLSERMFFVETDSGEKIGTASAYFDILRSPLTDPGWLHWVAIKNEFQGKRIARPLISNTLEQLVNLGYKHLVVSTQTNTWLAVKLYLDFGFVPTTESLAESYDGWKIIKRLTMHPSLRNIETADDAEVMHT